MTTADERPRVHIVDSLDTSGIGDEIIRGLDTLGVDAAAPPPDDATAADGAAQPALRAVVVLLSQRSFDDPVWRRRVEALRGERLVPVLAGSVDDHDVPPFLAELNWVIYRPGDASFFARLFTGINTDASRFRDAQDTRALAERWIGAGKSHDFLLEDRRELRRRIRAAATGVDGRDPLLPAELASALVGGFRERYRTIAGILSEGDDAAPKWFTVPASLWMAAFRGIYAKEVAQSAEPVVAFLGSSQLYAMGLQRQRVWRAAYRSALAVATVVAVVVSVVSIRQALLRSTNAVAFAFVDAATSNRPDLAAIKAAASLADSASFGGSDGRLRLAADALSQHWPLGYLSTDGWSPAAVSFREDGSITALDNVGSLWTWNIEDGTRTSTPSGVTSVAGGDIASDGSAFITTDGSVLQVGSVGGPIDEVPDLSDIRQLRLAPSGDRALVQAGNVLYRVSGIDDGQPTATDLGTFDDVLDIVQTTDGRALALAVRDDDLYLVRDDGESRMVAPAPAGTSNGALAPSGEAFVIEADQVLWTSDGGEFASSGVRVPGVVTALAISDDGLVIVSDRTRGTWAADPALGVELGAVCNGFAGTSSLTVDARGERVVCLQASFIAVDNLAQLRPAARDVTVPAPTTSVRSDGPLTSLALVDGLIRLDRADGTTFAFDSAGVSLAPGYEPPASIADADFFATGALVGATGTATTVAATPAGDTFAIGFADGRVIEVDLENESMARVGTWQLPDHAAVSSIDWSEDLTEIEVTTATGTQWSRSSCAGCWNRDLLTERIAERVWLCYPRDDIDALGDSARALFRLRDCESRWEDVS